MAACADSHLGTATFLSVMTPLQVSAQPVSVMTGTLGVSIAVPVHGHQPHRQGGLERPSSVPCSLHAAGWLTSCSLKC